MGRTLEEKHSGKEGGNETRPVWQGKANGEASACGLRPRLCLCGLSILQLVL